MTDVAWQSGEGRGRECEREGRHNKWWAKGDGGEEVRGRAGVRDGEREREGTDVERGGEGDRKRSMAVP